MLIPIFYPGSDMKKFSSNLMVLEIWDKIDANTDEFFGIVKV